MADIKRFLPENVKKVQDKFTEALLDSINLSDERLEGLVRGCIDQLFLTTASGRYLVQLGEQEGFTMPPNSGLDIRAYRVLVPIMVSAPKQIRRTIEELVQAFYGVDRTKPNITASTPQPYNLADGDDIVVETESGQFSLSILGNQVSDISSVSAGELSAVINTLQSIYRADVKIDRSSGESFLRLTTQAEGANAFIHILGGTIQNVLKFPNSRNTSQSAGINWIVSKEQPYSDIMTFQWDGIGVNPNIYLVSVGDFATIRGLVDTAQPLSLINGSYEVIDVGYDYFVVRNERFTETSASFLQPEDDSIWFTNPDKVRLFSLPEFALSAEIDNNTATVSVPAIPPLARRFRSGATHLQGVDGSVISFTRGNLKAEVPLSLDRPSADNAFVMSNKRSMYDLNGKNYRTSGIDDSQLLQPTLAVETGSGDFAVLPFTTPTLLGTGSIYGRPGSDEFSLTTEARHGLLTGWGFNIGSAIGSGNAASMLLNQEHIVHRVVDDHTLIFKLFTPTGLNLVFSGLSVSGFDIYRHSLERQDQSDFYFEFPTALDLTNSGITIGSLIKLDGNIGTNINGFYGQRLRYTDLFVVAIDNNIAHIRAGFGHGPQGLIIQGALGARDDSFGGPGATYHFDQTSSYNVDNVMDRLKIVFLAPGEKQNPNYVGSFIYDPDGVEYTVTVSRYIAKTTEQILKGGNDNIVFVETVDNVFEQENFPTSGQLVISYGTDLFEGPVRYIATISSATGDSQIILDPSYRFKNSHPVGTQLQFIHDTIPYRPGVNGSDFPAYLTGAAQARNTLFTLIEFLVAAGVFLQTDVSLPELRYQDPAIEPFV